MPQKVLLLFFFFSGKQVTSSLARPEIHPSTSVNSTLIFNERAACVNPSGENAKKVLNKIYIWRKIFFSNKCALGTAQKLGANRVYKGNSKIVNGCAT